MSAKSFKAIQTKLAPVMLAHKDPRASVATILGRLVEYGDLGDYGQQTQAGMSMQ